MIITLCGSARFEAWFHMWNEALGLAGHAVFGLCAYPSMHGGKREWYDEDEKSMLDEVHKMKIRASDAVVVLNVLAYMGPSTLSEFETARRIGKKIYFLESWGKGFGIYGAHRQECHDACARFGVPLATVEGGGSPIDTSKFLDVWVTELLGYGCPARSRIVERLKQREAEALGWAR